MEEMTIIRRFGCIRCLLAGGGWDAAGAAGVGCRLAASGPALVVAGVGGRVELKTHLRSPEQQPIQNQIHLVKHKAIPPGVLVQFGKFSRNGRADI